MTVTAVSEPVTPGSIWRHKNGNRYTVILIANEKSGRDEYPITVVYRGDNGNVWARHLSRWHGSMTLEAPGGQST